MDSHFVGLDRHLTTWYLWSLAFCLRMALTINLHGPRPDRRAPRRIGGTPEEEWDGVTGDQKMSSCGVCT